MRRLLSFGPYVFDNNVSNFTDNFRDTITRTVRLPYADGGFDQIGRSRAPLAIGKIQVGYWLTAPNGANMAYQKDWIKGMTNLGIQQMFIQTEDPNKPLRFTWARISHMNVNEDADTRGDLSQFVNIYWHAPDPHWYSAANNGAYWGSGVAKWGDGVSLWGGDLTEQSYTGPSQTMDDIENAGNADTTARIRLRVDTGQTLTNPSITVTTPAFDTYTLTYNGTINAGETLVIDGRSLSVKLIDSGGNESDAYGNMTVSDLNFLNLPPGSNGMTMSSSSAGDACTVIVDWLDAYT